MRLADDLMAMSKLFHDSVCVEIDKYGSDKIAYININTL